MYWSMLACSIRHQTEGLKSDLFKAISHVVSGTLHRMLLGQATKYTHVCQFTDGIEETLSSRAYVYIRFDHATKWPLAELFSRQGK